MSSWRGAAEVELCPGVYGKELFHGIKRAGHHAKHMLQLIRWPVLISNRLALAIAGLWWGGEESYTLLASDCATAKAEQVEAWTPPTEHKIESRARAPAAFLTWTGGWVAKCLEDLLRLCRCAKLG